MTRKTRKEYKDAARRLQNRFPALEKLAKKRGKYTPSEKAQITRAQNITAEMRKPKKLRKPSLRNYIFPAMKHPPDSFYRKEARRIAKFTNDPTKYREWAKEPLTGGRKAAIRKKSRLLSHSENVFKLTPAQVKKISPQALVKSERFDKKTGRWITESKLNAVRFRSTGADARIKSVRKDGTVIVISNGRTWFYVPVSPPEQELLAAAAEDAFAKGASAVYIWTVHGRVSGGAEDMEEILVQLAERYMQYLAANVEKAQSTDWLLGIAYYI